MQNACRNIKDQENLAGKIALLRLDLNVPLKNKDILDETRIDKIIPVINFLLNRKTKILIISHVGRPKGKKNNDLSHLSLIKQSRLSVMDIDTKSWKIINKMGNIDK